MSLIELLVAVSILAVGLVGAAMALSRAARATRTANERSIAIQLVRNMIEQVRVYYLSNQPSTFAQFSCPLSAGNVELCTGAGICKNAMSVRWLCDTDGAAVIPPQSGDSSESESPDLTKRWCCPSSGWPTGAVKPATTTCPTSVTVSPAPITNPTNWNLFTLSWEDAGTLKTAVHPMVLHLDDQMRYTGSLLENTDDSQRAYGPFVFCWRVDNLIKNVVSDVLTIGSPPDDVSYPAMKRVQVMTTWCEPGGTNCDQSEGYVQRFHVATLRLGY